MIICWPRQVKDADCRNPLIARQLVTHIMPLTQPRLILASTSRYRRELLERLGIGFETLPPGVDERPEPHEIPSNRARRLALAKAMAIAGTQPGATVIGSDQVADCQGEVLDKPGTVERCRQQLRRLSGHTATYHTAVAIVRLQPGAATPEVHQFVDTTVVHARELSDAEIERYIQHDQPLDCAGGFRSEALGITLFARVESADPTALIGLPLIGVAGALRQFGFLLP